MKKLHFIILIHMLLYSCIEIIIDEEFYESIHLQRSGWFEFYEDNQNEKLQFEIDTNSSIQIWFSGQEQLWEISPCILNIEGENNNLSIYRTLNTNNEVAIYLNDALLQTVELESADFNDETKFYLLSAVMNNGQFLLYFNNTALLDEPVEWDGPYYSYQIGTSFNEEEHVTNLWYGYIDEIRLWETSLTQEVVDFHYEYPDKVSSSYNEQYLEHLMGLWDFKINTLGEDNPSHIFQDINDYQMYTILYTSNTGTQNELSTNGR